MNFGIELSFSLFRIYDVLIYKNPNLISCGDKLHDLSLTFSSFLSVTSIFFPKLSFSQTEYHDLSLTFSSFLSVAWISFPKLSFSQTEYQNGLTPHIFLIKVIHGSNLLLVFTKKASLKEDNCEFLPSTAWKCFYHLVSRARLGGLQQISPPSFFLFLV